MQPLPKTPPRQIPIDSRPPTPAPAGSFPEGFRTSAISTGGSIINGPVSETLHRGGCVARLMVRPVYPQLRKCRVRPRQLRLVPEADHLPAGLGTLGELLTISTANKSSKRRNQYMVKPEPALANPRHPSLFPRMSPSLLNVRCPPVGIGLSIPKEGPWSLYGQLAS